MATIAYVPTDEFAGMLNVNWYGGAVKIPSLVLKSALMRTAAAAKAFGSVVTTTEKV